MELLAERQLETAVKIAHSLFDRGKVSGSTANISVRVGDEIYISGGGTSFGTLKPEHFARMSLDGKQLGGIRPSKEFPLHAIIYRNKADVGGVIHTHSFYATLWSCLQHENMKDVIPAYTPYLKMKVGTVGEIPYAFPGSEELFRYMEERVGQSDAYLLKQHGPVVAGKTILDAFYGLEELEESAKIAWYLRGEQVSKLDFDA